MNQLKHVHSNLHQLQAVDMEVQRDHSDVEWVSNDYLTAAAGESSGPCGWLTEQDIQEIPAPPWNNKGTTLGDDTRASVLKLEVTQAVKLALKQDVSTSDKEFK